MQERLYVIESKLGLIDDHLEELNRTVFRQQQQIDLLQQQLRLLYAQIHQVQGDGAEASNPRDEIPPHY